MEAAAGEHLGEELGDAVLVAQRRANTTGHSNSHDCGGTTQPWRWGGEADRYGGGVRVEDLLGGETTRRRRRTSEAEGETRKGRGEGSGREILLGDGCYLLVS